MRHPLFLISLALSSMLTSAACSQAEDVSSGTAQAIEPPAAPEPPEAPAAEGIAVEDDEERNGGTREFSYSWPAAISAQPALASQLAEERDAALAAQKAEWQQSLVDFPGDCVTCKGRGYQKEWKVVADIPGWLSLSADIYEYTGGAHGNYTRQSLVWNEAEQVAAPGVSLFKSPVALENALGAQLCEALDRAREARRGVPVDRSNREGFNDCPGLDEASVFVGSSNDETFDRIGVYFGPYVAGPYAEGAYELNFGVSASVLDAVKPEHASAFTLGR